MPIYVDSTEVREGSRLSLNIPFTKLDWLEEKTGADILITPLKIPVSEKLFQKHMESNAILIQRKSGKDLIHSIKDERLYRCIAKMKEKVPTAYQSQILLLITGSFRCASGGNLFVGDELLDFPYMNYIAGISGWNDAGGTHIVLQSDEHIQEYLVSREKKLIENKEAGFIRFLYQPEIMTFKDVDDFRKTIFTFPGMGEKRTQALYTYMVENGMPLTLFDALKVLTDTKYVVKVGGLGAYINKTCRAWIGLLDWYDLDMSAAPIEYQLARNIEK